MKTRLNIFLIAFFTSQSAFAKCGPIPVQPALLNETQIDIKQLEALEPQFAVYLESVDFYQACIDNEVTSIDVDSEDYQTAFEDKTRLWDAAEEQKLLANERYNMHIETVDTALSEEANTQ